MSAERLILTGFMGMGKSSAGRRAARMLKVAYYDTDDWMENVLFVQAGAGKYAIPLDRIRSTEKIDSSSIEHIGNDDFIHKFGGYYVLKSLNSILCLSRALFA